MSNIFQKIREKEEISPVGSKISLLKRPASGKSNRLSKAGQPSVPAKEKAVPLEWKRLSRLKHPFCYRLIISISSQHLHLTRQANTPAGVITIRITCFPVTGRTTCTK